MFPTIGRSDFHARPTRPLAVLLTFALAACGGGSHNSANMGPPLSPTVTLQIQPTTITFGQAATLTWSSTDASTCAATGGWTGTEATNGTQAVTPTASGSTTYTLTCTAPSGGTYSGGGGGMTAMSVTLTVNAASAYSFTNLVSDTAGTSAVTTDPNLVNPWGIVFGPTSPVWTSNGHTQTSTLYDGNGHPQPAATPLVVHLPNGAADVTFDPTGIVFNGSMDFVVSATGGSGAAAFIFSGEGGMIAGWSPSADILNAIIKYTDTGGAVYKGLALANNGTANFLYAADFHNNKVDVFDATYTKQVASATSFAFIDPTLPAGYAPFGIQAIKNGTQGAAQIYVAYAVQQGPDNHDNSNGAGLGLIDLFDANGNFVKRLVPPGVALNAPWGLALAPADFGTLSNALLVSNFGDGKINGYDTTSGTFLGAVTDSTGAPFSIPGLWGIAFGNDAANQPHNTLFFAAGTNDEANGVYGRIDLGAAPVLSAVPAVTAMPAPR